MSVTTLQSPAQLWRELKANVEDELEARGESRYANAASFLRLAAVSGVIAVCYGGILVIRPGALWLCLWTCLGVSVFILIANCGHDASHGSVFRSRIANRVLLILCFGLLGIDGVLWALRHLTAHHPHTNISDEDPDSVPNPYLRLSPHHPWRPWFRYQHLYALVLYSLALLETALVQDFTHIIRKPLPYTKKIRRPNNSLLRAFAVKALYAICFVAAPLSVDIPLAWVVLGILVKHGVASLVFVLTVGLNHYVAETLFHARGYVPDDHLIHQLVSSADWNPTSRFWCSVMGGANAHTAHHLFPALHHRHAPWISEQLALFCREHALPYNSFSFTNGVKSHFRFLYTLGQRPA